MRLEPFVFQWAAAELLPPDDFQQTKTKIQEVLFGDLPRCLRE